MMDLPMRYPELSDAIEAARVTSGTEKMRVFVLVPGPVGNEVRQVREVNVLPFHDPGETNWSVFLTLTGPGETQ